MKRMLVSIALLTFSAGAWSQQTVTELNWKDRAPGDLPRGAATLMLSGREALKIENTADAPLQLSLWTIPQPKIAAQMYAVMGEIRYDAVQGEGFLEMWSYFPPARVGMPEGQYFSRTLGDSGEMGKISGTSDWRRFSLPFNSAGASGPPSRLQINLILRGRGTVYLGPLKLAQYSGAKPALDGGPANAWWSDRTAGLIGGIAGSILGCLGGLVGVLCSMGKGRGLVIALLKLQIGLGILCGVAGIVALAQHQRYGVYYPLLLGTAILLLVCPRALSTARTRYHEQELRRMQSLDVSG